jgi:AmmeMemoRadiSam system protein A
MTPLGPEDRRTLLGLARRSIEARLAGRRPPDEPAAGALGERRGAFVTLRRRGDRELRGCVGYLEPRYALAEAVARAAASAATADDRFAPVTLDELARLTLDVSALGPLEPLAPADVRVGSHGLVIRWRGRSGLLLPQVALEHGWDARALLEHTCRKAGLPADTWREPDVLLFGFTADVFGEDEP